MTKRETFKAFLNETGRQVRLSAWENQQLDSNKPFVFISAGNGQCIKVYDNGGYELEKLPPDVTLKVIRKTKLWN